MAKRRNPPGQPYYTPGSIASRTAWNAPSDPNAAYPAPITPTDEPEPGSSDTPDDSGSPALPSSPSQPALTESPPAQALNPPPDQSALPGRTWESIQGLQPAGGQAQQPLAAQPQGTPRTWDSVNQGIQAGAAQGAQGGAEPPPEKQTQEQPPPAQLPEDEFKQKVAAATNVESKGGPKPTELEASTGETKLTHYGYADDKTPDSGSYYGIGDHGEKHLLTPGVSAALTQSERKARFGVTGPSTGKSFEYQGKTYTDDDTAPESDRRIDVYDPYGSEKTNPSDAKVGDKGVNAYTITGIPYKGTKGPPKGGGSSAVATTGAGAAGKTGGKIGLVEGEEGDEGSTWKPEEAAAAAEPTAAAQAATSTQQRQRPAEDLEENITSPMLNPPGGLMSPQQAAIQESAKAKKRPEEEEEGEGDEEEGTPASDAIASALAQYQSAPTQTAKKAALQTLKQAHLDSLSDNDTRVQHDPVTGKFKGTHFMGNDPVHQDALSSMPEPQKAKLAVAQNAIDANQLMHASYGSAQASPAVIPSRESREQEYAEDPAGQRSLANAQIAGHTFMPVTIGVTHGQKKGEANKGYIEGMSASFIAQNANHFNHALGAESPYPDITSPKFGDDFEGYIANLNNGWTGNGQSRVKGTAAVPIQTNEDYEPHLLTDQEANFMNAILHNIAGKNKGGESKQRALDLAAANGREVGPDGETNPFRALVDNRQSRRSWFPGQTEPPAKPWSDEMLASAYKTFHANLIHRLHDHPGQMPEGIRPPEGVDRIAAALQRRGVPHKDLVAANVVGGPVGRAEGKPPKPGGPGQMQFPFGEAQGQEKGKQIYWVHVDELEQHLKKKGRKKKT